MSKTIEEILLPKPEARPRIYTYSIDDKAHTVLAKCWRRRPGESQRDSSTQPRVARNELPWDTAPTIPQPQRGCVRSPRGGLQPRWGWGVRVRLPRVARSSQPWAEGLNPFGIERPRAVKQRVTEQFKTETNEN